MSSGICAIVPESISSGDAMDAGYLQFSILGLTSSPVFAVAGSAGANYGGAYGSEVLVGAWTMTDSRVPEPGTLALLGIGLFGMGLSRRKKV